MSVRRWKAGDKVRIVFAGGHAEVRVLSKRGADEMNDGENPYYPWRVERFEHVEEPEISNKLRG